jgi:hypothetical protein
MLARAVSASTLLSTLLGVLASTSTLLTTLLGVLASASTLLTTLLGVSASTAGTLHLTGDLDLNGGSHILTTSAEFLLTTNLDANAGATKRICI